VWFGLRLVYKVLIFLLFKLGLFLIALYVAGMHILDKWIYAGKLDIYGTNIVYYLIGLGLAVALTMLFWWWRQKRRSIR